MCSQSEVMHCYEQISPLTERMLELARAGQWGALPALEAQYSDTVERLRVIEPMMALDEAQAERKYRLLGRITSNHAELSDIVMPQLAQLGAMLRSLEQQQSLHSAYSQGTDLLS
jgi:flagellar protein FliT